MLFNIKKLKIKKIQKQKWRVRPLQHVLLNFIVFHRHLMYFRELDLMETFKLRLSSENNKIINNIFISKVPWKSVWREDESFKEKCVRMPPLLKLSKKHLTFCVLKAYKANDKNHSQFCSNLSKRRGNGAKSPKYFPFSWAMKKFKDCLHRSNLLLMFNSRTLKAYFKLHKLHSSWIMRKISSSNVTWTTKAMIC